MRQVRIRPLRSRSRSLQAYFLVLPVILLVALLAYGVVSSFIMSFQKVEVLLTERPFVGLATYLALFADEFFRQSLFRSLLFWVGCVALGITVALVYALALYRIKLLRRTARAIALAPFLISGVAVGITWRFLFSTNVGLFNQLFLMLGLQEISWLGTPALAFLLVMVATIWWIAPFPTIMLLGGLHSIDPMYVDAAVVDGATPFQMLRNVTLPLIFPVLGVSLIWLSYGALVAFDLLFPLTAGGPGRATEVLALLMYNIAFLQLNFSEASAILMVLILLNTIFSVAFLKIFKI